MANYLKGMHPFFAGVFYTAIIGGLLLDIVSHLLPGIYSIGFWVLVLVFEIVGIARKSSTIGDTLSESLWHAAKSYKARRIFTALIGLGIAAKILSFGFIYVRNWDGWSTLLYEPAWQGFFILSKVYLIFFAVGTGAWLWDHFKFSGRIG